MMQLAELGRHLVELGRIWLNTGAICSELYRIWSNHATIHTFIESSPRNLDSVLEIRLYHISLKELVIIKDVITSSLYKREFIICFYRDKCQTIIISYHSNFSYIFIS
jgi:hypothetical protein